jgi:hypothetical protein
MNIDLEYPLDTAVTASTTNTEAMCNPYSYLVCANYATGSMNDGFKGFLGLPARTATVGQNFWLQTWGPCWITSNSATCDSAGDRMIYFANNGSVVGGTDATIETGYQLAGFAIDASSSGSSNGPMVMLQISV